VSGRPELPPPDESNRRLLDHVHPADWSNPEPRGRYELVVIGAGTAGLITAAVAAGLGARVALVERHLMGGDCLNVGCVPSKALIRSSRLVAEARRAAALGLPEVDDAAIDFGAAMERLRRVRARISAADAAARYRDELGVDVFLGEARFAGPDAVEVDGRRLHFKKAVIATGARAGAPPIDGLEEAGYLTNETLF
jgi:pyruvate/2-oxoglutarate dehydrogenase complex dihydrolipoamide dehydrogenase (E3) component